jgi:CubicO group peptidase (beta-lactamase class C family)
MLRRIFLAASIAVLCQAQDAARMDQVVQSYVANKTFMGTALVAKGDHVLFSKGYGFANLEWNIPNAPNTKFRLGSVTKQFTAASILLLEERGKLKTDDPIKKYIPEAPAAWDKITLFHILTHTAGIPNFTSFPDYPKIGPFPTTAAKLLESFRDKPLDFDPGTKWNYSNSGYVVLTYVIEKVSGESYEKFVRDNIFTPLGMKDSGYDSNEAIIPNRASGYSPGRNGFENAGFVHMTVPQGAGALYSTTEDLLKWEQGLFGGKVLKPESLEKMTRPFLQNYAFGLSVETLSGRKVISHNGGIQGFNTNLTYYPDDKLTIVVLSNVNGPAPDELARKLAAVAHGEQVKLQTERKEITLDPKVLARHVGAYQMGPGMNMLVTLQNNQLFTKLGNQPDVAVYPESETMFFLKVVDAQVEFPDSTRLILHQNGRDMPAMRLSDAEAKQAMDAAAAFARRFKEQTAAVGSEAALRQLIEQLRVGKPDTGQLTVPGAAQFSRQVAQLQSAIAEKGALQSLTFKAVGPAGPDIYDAKFDKGSLECRIWLAPDGKIDNFNAR